MKTYYHRIAPIRKIGFHLIVTYILAILPLVSCDEEVNSPLTSQTNPEFSYFPQETLEIAATLTADGSGSGKEPTGIFATKKISINDVYGVISVIASSGGGILYLTYIDEDCRNNITCKLVIPSLKSRARPVLRDPYFSESDYDEERKRFGEQVKKFTQDSLRCIDMLEKLKKDKQSEISEFLNTVYKPRPINEDYSDVIGAVNNDVEILKSSNLSTVSRKVIILVSDFEHDISKEKKKEGYDPKLKSIPSDLTIYQINSISSGNIDIEKSWLPTFDDNSLQTILNKSK